MYFAIQRLQKISAPFALSLLIGLPPTKNITGTRRLRYDCARWSRL